MLDMFIVHAEADSGNLTADKNVDLTKPKWAKGMKLLADVDVITGTLAIKVQELIPSAAKGSDVWVDLPGASFPTLSTTNDETAHSLTIYPGIAETANISVSDTLAQQVRVVLDITTGPAPITIVGYWLG